MSSRGLINFFFFCLVLFPRRANASIPGLIPRVLQDLSSHRDLNQFAQLLRDSENLRRLLRHRELTIFAPVDAAFADFRGRLDENLLLYHLLPMAMELDGLVERAEQRQPMQSVSDQLPNIYLQVDRDILMVNDARVLKTDSNHQSRSRDDVYGKLQVMHKIDKVLSPMIVPVALGTSPTAYDFLAQTMQWPLVQYTFHNYYKRVIMTSSVGLYKDAMEAHTYLMPADEFRTALDDAAITAEVIRCSIVPSAAFVHRDVANTTHRTLSRNCHVSFEERAVHVHDTLNNRFRTIKILLANVPLRNGVAHVLERTPGVWQSRLNAVFPIRTLWDHINNDYFLQTQTALFQSRTAVELQNMRNDHPRNLTIFAVGDRGWEKFLAESGRSLEQLLDAKKLEKFMLRHVTEEVYDLQRLVDVSRTSLRGGTVMLGLGQEKIIARFVKGREPDADERGDPEQVTILWGVRKIRVLKGDIKCSNGIIHVIDAPFIFPNELKNEPFNLLKMWRAVSSLMY